VSCGFRGGRGGTYDDSDGNVIAIPAAFLGSLELCAGIEAVACTGADADAGDIGQGIWGGWSTSGRGRTADRGRVVVAGKGGRQVPGRVTLDRRGQRLWRQTSAEKLCTVGTCGWEISIKDKHKSQAGRTALGLASPRGHLRRVVRHAIVTPSHVTLPPLATCLSLTIPVYLSLLHKVPLERVLAYPQGCHSSASVSAVNHSLTQNKSNPHHRRHHFPDRADRSCIRINHQRPHLGILSVAHVIPLAPS